MLIGYSWKVRHPRRRLGAASLAAAFASVAAVAGSAPAATLSGSVGSPPANVNLTTEGSIDWAIWDYRTSGTGTTGAPSNEKAGGTAIPGMTAAVGTPRGITGSFGPPTYTYTDGTSTVSATAATIGAITDTTLNAVGPGFKLNLTGDPTKAETVRVYVQAFDATGTMSATLAGATTYADSTITSANGTRTFGVYTFTFQPNLVTDTLQLSYTIGTVNAGGSANVDLQAVTVGTVPEPTSAAVGGAAGLLLLARRRRRSA